MCFFFVCFFFTLSIFIYWTATKETKKKCEYKSRKRSHKPRNGVRKRIVLMMRFVLFILGFFVRCTNHMRASMIPNKIWWKKKTNKYTNLLQDFILKYYKIISARAPLWSEKKIIKRENENRRKKTGFEANSHVNEVLI